MNIRWILPATAGSLLLAAACADAPDMEGVVARAGDYVLSVDETVELLVDQEALPAQREVVSALADLWIDYTLLADAAARDSTFEDIDMDPLVRQQLEQQMIFRLRDSVMQVDTVIPDEELRELFSREAPGARVEASHILLGFPPDPTQAERDSVRSEMESLLERARRGESFAALARRYSQDQGSAAQGGSLGTFGRGEMVRPFEEAAFALQPGEISDIVETPFGLHIIRVDGREDPDFTEEGEQFRLQVINRRILQADSAFVAAIEERAAPEVQEGALTLMKDLAASPDQVLAGRAARRALTRYEGGAYTVGEFQTFLQTQSPEFRAQVQAGTDTQLENLLRGLVQRKLLVEEARASGLEPPREQVDSLRSLARTQLREAARQIGVLRLDRAPGEDLEPAVSRAVIASLEAIVAGGKDVIPLGPIAFQLRQGEATAISEEGIGEAILRIGQIRASRSPAPLEQARDSAEAPGN